jgi:hypothetical protein
MSIDQLRQPLSDENSGIQFFKSERWPSGPIGFEFKDPTYYRFEIIPWNV